MSSQCRHYDNIVLFKKLVTNFYKNFGVVEDTLVFAFVQVVEALFVTATYR